MERNSRKVYRAAELKTNQSLLVDASGNNSGAHSHFIGPRNRKMSNDFLMTLKLLTFIHFWRDRINWSVNSRRLVDSSRSQIRMGVERTSFDASTDDRREQNGKAARGQESEDYQDKIAETNSICTRRRKVEMFD